MKMHEYFASGKPVVATELENLKEFGGVLHFAESAEDWVEAIERNLDSFTLEQQKQRIAIAEANSWGERVCRISGVIKKKLKDA